MGHWLSTLSIARRMILTLLAVTAVVTLAMAGVVATAVDALGASSATGHRVLIESLVQWFLLLVVIAILWHIMSRTIVQPLTTLVLFTQQMRRQETQGRLQEQGATELATVAASINAMLDDIVGQRDRLRARVEQLMSEVRDVGTGDLRRRAQVSDDALGVLAATFNYVVEQLSQLIIEVQQVTTDVHGAAFSTWQQTSTSADVAERQRDQIRTAFTTLASMVQASRQVAVSAEHLGQETLHARDLTLTGRARIAEIIRGMHALHEEVQQTGQHVQRLAERSAEMQQVLDVLETLANQTNRLALDAAIQAAMAGDNGKGFEAIAADIRRLAERSKEEVRKSEALVRGVKGEIQAAAASMNETEQEALRGDQYVRETETVFMTIFTLAEQQSSGIEAIIAQSAQQVAASETMEALMSEVSDATVSSSAMIRGIAVHISEVARKASQLERSVGVFRLPERGERHATRALSGAVWSRGGRGDNR